ncbi:DUF6086 family protein [Allostreptomyces psammosilenae]|uniref:Uncharacterized protein n=1 Tax=Allostreptomyces psammosilenae TaxID=1892865 RepID=A0A852ZZI7_9ACTN|nr:DUF6086 family protein [Allostreptomyces psammosilenae]NYI07237.1 hypothetical protein [Allostreptomyces psammosilenae]
MSYVFDVNDQTVWSPSLRLGRLYVSLTECIGQLMGCPTGLVPVAGDMFNIDVEQFRGFVRTVFDDYFSTDHPVYRQQLRGFLLTSLVMLGRGGVSLEAASDEQRALLAEAELHGRSMAL